MPSSAKVWPQSKRKKLILCIDDYKQGLHARKLVLETAGYAEGIPTKHPPSKVTHAW